MQLDLHMHTKYSFDCNMEPEKIVKVAKARGLDGIAITDHNTTEGAYEVQKYAASNGLLVIIGEEIATTAGDVIGLFIKESIVNENPVEAIDEIKRQGGIAVLPHPFTRHLSIEEKVARKLDACEGFNARHAREKILDNSYGEAHIREFAQQYDLSLTAGSDSHFYREIGRARTIVPASSLEEAKDAILKGNTALMGRKSSPFNRLGSVLLRTFRNIVNPVPEAYTMQKKNIQKG